MGDKMNRVVKLKSKIENLRDELNQSIVKDQYEVYYAKSVELDKLIAEYIELEEQIPA